MWVRSCLSAGGATTAADERKTPAPVHVPFGSSLAHFFAQHLWLVGNDDIYQQFTFVDLTTPSWLPTALMLAVVTSPRGSAHHPEGWGYIVPEASHPIVANGARSGRIPMAVHRVMSWYSSHNSYFKRLRVALTNLPVFAKMRPSTRRSLYFSPAHVFAL